MSIILIGGGSRSGKSSYAQHAALARAEGRKPVYIATARIDDDIEMRERIQRHRDDRGDAFTLVEAPLDVASALSALDTSVPVVVDCLTIWLANVLEHDRKPDPDALIISARGRTGATYFVTNEVGEGIVPMHPLARRFRDESGFMNQRMAAAADEVIFLRFGLPQRLK
jgi:adenosylcobinamide kinase/adenosylcobinamide-phosphate guanylyltransferase